MSIGYTNKLIKGEVKIMAKPIKMNTETGFAIYPKVNTVVDTYDGKETGYTVQMKFNKEYQDKLIGELNKIFNDAQGSKDFEGKKWSAEPSLGFAERENKETKEMETIFKFHTKHTYKDKDSGEELKKIVPIFDAKGNRMPDDTALGHGSLLKISFSPTPFHLSAKNNGVTLYLNAIQVIDLVEYQAGFGSFGFASEDGYVSEAPKESDSYFPEEY
jgi:hypothetical protein